MPNEPENSFSSEQDDKLLIAKLKALDSKELIELGELYRKYSNIKNEIKNIDVITEQTNLVIESIDSVLRIYDEAYPLLILGGIDFSDKADKMKIYKKHIEEEIKKSQLANEYIPDTPLDNYRLPFKKTINKHELAYALGKGWSVSFIEKNADKLIPEECFVNKYRNKRNIQLMFLTEKIRKWIDDGMPSPNQRQLEKTEEKSKLEKKTSKPRKDYRLTFAISLDRFIKPFVKNEYLDEENAILFTKRFQSCFLTDDKQKIKWKRDLLSLMTFILVSCRLRLIDNEKSDFIKDQYSGDDIVPMEAFFNNFEDRTGFKKTEYSKKKKLVINVLDNIEEKVLKKNNKKDLTFNNILKLYFEQKQSITLLINSDNRIDLTMLEIVFNSCKNA